MAEGVAPGVAINVGSRASVAAVAALSVIEANGTALQTQGTKNTLSEIELNDKHNTPWTHLGFVEANESEGLAEAGPGVVAGAAEAGAALEGAGELAAGLAAGVEAAALA